MAHLSIHDIKEYIQLCLHDVLLRGLMEDVSEPAIAAKLYAINLLLRLQPREVAALRDPGAQAMSQAANDTVRRTARTSFSTMSLSKYMKPPKARSAMSGVIVSFFEIWSGCSVVTG
eukprot:CAMPEP_0115552230 /NCGR_PEP_ID=MMETSP0271-20121206/96131_1 /TAXON_ID=71861 /ORGANISM="Scrippsiella trochoidea, Strain CCMP3099" /LENGTH=116 /DNA_ID=CAMNT_0002985839 /DNA_START=373 /DNA_END=722 /DNA_ORIENTATION=+